MILRELLQLIKALSRFKNALHASELVNRMIIYSLSFILLSLILSLPILFDIIKRDIIIHLLCAK